MAPLLAGLVRALGVVRETATHYTKTTDCPPFNNGTFVINQFQLYPENADFDAKHCLVYFGALFNASVSVFDPYKNEIIESITFPNISGNPALHVGAASVDPSGLLTVLVDAATPFATGGQDVSGDNFIIKYDIGAKEVLWQRNITAVSQGTYGGFQDVEHDSRENIYIVGTYPGSISRLDKNGNNLQPWFLPVKINTTIAGFGGLATTPGDILLTNNNADGQIYRFDMRQDKGTPVLVPRTPNTTIEFSDAILLPSKYNGTVLLVSEDAVGVTVLRSKDRTWTSAETLGRVSNNVTAAQGGQVSATLQIGSNGLFMVEEFFADLIVQGTTAGNRTQFPMVDIATQVDDLLMRHSLIVNRSST